MPHQRQVIRKAVNAAILAANTVAGDRVYPTQKLTYATKDLPAIAVYTPTEKSSLDRTAPRELTRVCDVIVEAICEAPTDGFVDDIMDAIAVEIETVMDTDPYFNCEAAQSSLVETDAISKPDGDREIGILTMTYSFVYRTDAFVAPTSPSDFNTASTTYDLGGEQDPADQTTDETTVQ